MLRITIPQREVFDEKTMTFSNTNARDLVLEHSLVSISKWESKYHKSFLDTKDKTTEETLDYILCMMITQNVDPSVLTLLTQDNLIEINEYIANPSTATTFTEDTDKSKSRVVVTAEIIYGWMIALRIPMECQKWHINRLLTLIRVCNIQQSEPKKMSRSDILKRQREMNAIRRTKYNTKG